VKYLPRFFPFAYNVGFGLSRLLWGVGVILERRTIIVPVNVSKPSPVRRFFRRYPMARAFAFAVAFAVALALVGALINMATSHIPGNSSGANPLSGVQVPVLDQGSSSSSGSPAAQQAPAPYPAGSCVSGDFSGKTPEDVSGASCSSGQAEYEIVDEFPGATDPKAACEGIKGAKLGYLEQYTENGAIVSSIVYCLGDIVQ
jgi:hypothetical protein